MLNELTIIIPTYNRVNFINRSFNFWEQTGIKFLICDSSSEINFKLNKHNNYFYTKNNKFYVKLFEAINLVKTKYAVIIADDDIPIIDSLKECLIFLDKNDTFVSAQGAFIDFWYNEKNDIDICVRNPDNSGINSNLIYSDTNLRIYNSINQYWHHIYSIHRTDVLYEALKISKNLKNNPAAEINITLVGSIFGNHKMVENLYMCRQILPIDKINFSKRETFIQWINNKNNKDNLMEWINQLSKLHSKINNFPIEISKSNIEKAILSFNKKKVGIKEFIKILIKFIVPKKFLNIFRHPLYYKKSWPPTTDEARKIRSLSTRDKFYPWSSESANKQWIKIKNFLYNYGKVEGNSFKI